MNSFDLTGQFSFTSPVLDVFTWGHFVSFHFSRGQLKFDEGLGAVALLAFIGFRVCRGAGWWAGMCIAAAAVVGQIVTRVIANRTGAGFPTLLKVTFHWVWRRWNGIRYPSINYQQVFEYW